MMVNPRARFLAGERGELRFPEVNYIFCVAKNLKIPKLHKIPKLDPWWEKKHVSQ